MKTNWLDYTLLSLVIIGAINWGLIGFFHFDLVAFIFGVTTLPDFANYTLIPSIEPTFLKLDFAGVVENIMIQMVTKLIC